MTNRVCSTFLICHGRTSYNAARKLQGQVDIPLDAVGEWQIEQVAAALKRLHVDRRQKVNHRLIVCSNLKRAHATVQAFTDVLGGVEPVDDRRVHERSFSDWDDRIMAELAERCPGDFRSWMESRGGELKYGAKPEEAMGRRGVEALEDRSTRAGDDTDLFVFSHGAWIAWTPQALLGIFAIDLTFPTAVLLRNVYRMHSVSIDNPDGTVRWRLLDYSHGPAIVDADEQERKR